jgi:hypothetical protein
MKQKKTWFIGFTSRLWVPVSFEGWLVTASFFTGIIIIGKMNNVSNDASLNISQIILILLEFFVLLGFLYFVTKGHVDKRY